MRTIVNTIPKLFRFSQSLLKMGEKRAEQLGISFQEYVKYLIVSDIDTNYTLMDEETEKRVGESLKDIEKGNFVELRSSKDIVEYFDKLDKQAK